MRMLNEAIAGADAFKKLLEQCDPESPQLPEKAHYSGANRAERRQAEREERRAAKAKKKKAAIK